jgi:hypothetical protein
MRKLIIFVVVLGAAIPLALAGSAVARQRLRQAPVPAAPPVALPADWPLSFIAPPTGSYEAAVPAELSGKLHGAAEERGLPFNEGTINEGRTWGVNFGYDAGWSEYVAQLAAVVLPRGYTLYWEKTDSGREYISRDGKYIVQLLYFEEADLYKLSVMVYTNPWPGAEPRRVNT